jgi:hypothetical protein
LASYLYYSVNKLFTSFDSLMGNQKAKTHVDIEPGLALLKPPTALTACLSELAELRVHLEIHAKVFLKALSTHDKRDPAEQPLSDMAQDANQVRR